MLLSYSELLYNGNNHASLIAQLVKNLPAVQETWVRSLGWEDPLEKELPGKFHGLRVGHN